MDALGGLWAAQRIKSDRSLRYWAIHAVVNVVCDQSGAR